MILAQTTAGFFAADRIIFIHRPNIHKQHVWEVTSNGLIGTGDARDPRANHLPEDTLALELVALAPDLKPLTASADTILVTSAIQLAQHIEGPVAGRLVRILYRLANDPPTWRQPRVTIDVNTLLDDLGYARDERGYHRGENRARVRDVLLALSRVEVRGERYDHASGLRQLTSAPLVSIRGGSYEREETRSISLSELLEVGLPSELIVELGWYEGVRRRDGHLGNQYVLLPRDLTFFQGQGQADHLATEERLAEFLWLRYSLQQGRSPDIMLTLDVALRHAGITNKNTTRARETLQKALDRLLERGQLSAYSPLPLKRRVRLTVTLQVPPRRRTAPLTTPSLWEPVNPVDDAPALVVSAEDAQTRVARQGASQAGSTREAQAIAGAHAGAVSSRQITASQIPDAADAAGVFGEAPTTSTVQSVLPMGTYSLSVSQAWRRILQEATPLLNPHVVDHLRTQGKPVWLADTLVDGDILYWLYVSIPTGLLPRLSGAESTLQQVALRLWQNAFNVLIGPPYEPPR